MTVTIVVAIGRNGVIGRDGDLPWPPTGDLAQFKALTMGHPMVMGRTTYESIGRPLPGRTSIVLTRDPQWAADGVEVADGLPSALAQAEKLDDDVFLIGGSQVYAAAIEAGVVDRMVVTHVHLAPDGDAWFPEVDWSQWRETDRQPYDGYDIATYDRVAP
ncbi:dihydrofolate reductase [Aeromicrobium chenweiae]|uniref:Dihydrofolate reductase n=1 Tax=Aeromicrobium chenweiae TaxID=2079793 RepID=A0A2S0WN63_9ACTN|nr:dihydrofolate reductase [Aeromicrobium chenweiae]AWB92742.1 dihydrofolate reductase [Aeromicrobium chenweiae]TGN33733.1 dihydrofolate reductase [Aeromicrobium chenweiae]